ncbi:MAG TPA: septum formation protein Maf [Anaerolineae bacterium]|nr:septum formation protein Maf [Anaerolineae bacterium]
MLILASQSPRRRQLLASLDLDFTVAVPDVDERSQVDESPIAVVERLSQAKAEAVAAQNPNSIVLAADTVVALDGEVLGKPADLAEARRMLERLRGRSHQVYSAVTATNAKTGERATMVNVSVVWMRDYDDAWIRAYVASGDPLDKAGGYAIQNQQFTPVARLKGCYSSVMGLPLGDTVRVLREVGMCVLNLEEVARICQEIVGSSHWHCCLDSRNIGADFA